MAYNDFDFLVTLVEDGNKKNLGSAQDQFLRAVKVNAARLGKEFNNVFSQDIEDAIRRSKFAAFNAFDCAVIMLKHGDFKPEGYTEKDLDVLQNKFDYIFSLMSDIRHKHTQIGHFMEINIMPLYIRYESDVLMPIRNKEIKDLQKKWSDESYLGHSGSIFPPPPVIIPHDTCFDSIPQIEGIDAPLNERRIKNDPRYRKL